MRKLICIIVLLATSLFLITAGQVNRNKYRHVRTNKKAWGQELASDMDSLNNPIEVYVASDSVLIVSDKPHSNINVRITNYLNGGTEMFSHCYEQPSNEWRISIIPFPEGIYEITIWQLGDSCFLFGYFAKGEQYEEQAEALGIPAVLSYGALGKIVMTSVAARYP